MGYGGGNLSGEWEASMGIGCVASAVIAAGVCGIAVVVGACVVVGSVAVAVGAAGVAAALGVASEPCSALP